MVHDELRFQHREELMQDLSKETITQRNNSKQRALPMRTYGTFIVGEGVGGAGSHWNGQTYRFLPYDFEIRSQTIDRYGKQKSKQNIRFRIGALPMTNLNLIIIHSKKWQASRVKQ